MNFAEKIGMIATMQYEYAELVAKHKLSKKAICDICCPVRDALSLTDIQTLQIARQELPLYDIIKILDEKKGNQNENANS